MAFIAIILTNNQNILVYGIIATDMHLLVLFCILCVILASFIMYVLAYFFYIPNANLRELYRIVQSGSELKILKRWKEMDSTNHTFGIIGMFVNVVIILGCYYISISFIAVWKQWNLTWLIGWTLCFMLDFVIGEFTTEGIIACLYARRAKSDTSLRLSNWINEVRNYRTLWP